MTYRLKVFGLHLLGSATGLTLILGVLYLGWYSWPGWYLVSVLHIAGLVVLVDLVIGPILTLIVANPSKSYRVLARDFSVIVTAQLAALIYGAAALWIGRPLYYTYSIDRLELIQASDIEKNEIDLARQQNPALAPHWYSLPRWIWAPLPEDPHEAMRIVNRATFGRGSDIVDMPRFFRPWQAGLPKLREQLARVSDIAALAKTERHSLQVRMSAQGLAPEQRNALLLWGGSRRVLTVFDPDTLRIEAILEP